MPAFTQTGTYNQPVIAFPTITGLTVSGGSPGGTTVIPLLLTAYSPPLSKANIIDVTSMPIVRENFSFGGNAVGDSGVELPKIHLEGHIDTPTTTDGSYQIPDVVLGGRRYTYAELIIIYFEGRAGDNGWGLVNPSYFRDPYGRQYNNIQILDFSAGYVEAVPARTTFQMTLRV